MKWTIAEHNLNAALQRIRLRPTIRLMAKASLPACSKNTITGNTGNPAYLKQFQVSRKSIETEEIHPDTTNGGHNPDRKP